MTFSVVKSLPRFGATLLSRKGCGYMQILGEVVDRMDQMGSSAKKVCKNVTVFLESVKRVSDT